jgi:type IV pilus assembly protein PilA
MKLRNHPKRPGIHSGFTLMELMIVVAVIAILATLTMPSLLAQRQRRDVAEAIKTAKNIRDSVTDYYYLHLTFPADNEDAGVPEPDYLIGNKVTGMEIIDGVINIKLGNKAAKPLQNKIVSIRPAVVTGSPSSPISWLCGYEKPVDGMEAVGTDETNVVTGAIPASCNN